MNSEDSIWIEYSHAEEPSRSLLQEKLLLAMRTHAFALVWQQLYERRPDIVNTALWNAQRSWGTFRGDAKFSTWFSRIVLNLCRDSQRGIAKRREVGLEDAAEIVIEPQTDAVVARDILSKVVAKLDPTEKVLVEMKLADRTDGEVAVAMGIGEGLVRVRWSFLRRKLRRRLKAAGYGSQNRLSK